MLQPTVCFCTTPVNSTVVSKQFSISYCFLLLLQLLVQLKLPFNLRINIWYYRAPELIFGATKYTTAINICSRYRFRC
ncbi:hypothetical protein ERO13_A06G117400v2 [Gossypium hirsutum]|nr:hypothetical protein ERO13_A06G117400v2 [Gossypium hirsutum]